MTRKDSEKDTERPHYYSQFWLDVAAGRRVIGTPKPEEGTEPLEAEAPEPIPLRKAGRTSMAPVTDGYKETRSPSVVEPEPAPDEYAEPEPDEFELEDNVDELELPNIVVDEEPLEDTSLSDLDYLAEEEEEPEEEDFYEEEEEEEEEEDEDWSVGRGKKKPKPGRQVKQPKPQKKPKRDSRRGF